MRRIYHWLVQNYYVLFHIPHINRIEGWLSLTEAICLYRLSRSLKNNPTIVEIGSWKGRSTYCLAKGIKKGQVIVIDPFDASGEKNSLGIYNKNKGDKPILTQFRSNMLKGGVLDKITIFHGKSQNFIAKVPKINLLFIDGDHSKKECYRDYLNYSSKITNMGYLIFHDFDLTNKNSPIVWLVSEIISKDKGFTPMFTKGSLWVAQKTS